MIRRVVCSLVVGTVLATTATAIEAPLPRHPAPSPDGSQIAFSWQGDLWLVSAQGGQASRLTVHPSVERFPQWSRDGHLIAFVSNRHGNNDVFVMPVDRSAAPTRLTFASTDDFANDFTPDGRSVLFASQRYEGVSRGLQLWTASLSGGTPTLVQDAFGQNAAYSTDGETLAFVRGGTKWTRRGYRGAAARNLWTRTPDGEFLQLTDFDGDVADSGEGRWTVKTAVELGVPAHVLSTALFNRFSSRGEATYANKVLSALRYAFGGHVEKS